MQLSAERAEIILSTYTLETLLELSDLTEADILCFLYQHRMIKLPETLPIDLEND